MDLRKEGHTKMFMFSVVYFFNLVIYTLFMVRQVIICIILIRCVWEWGGVWCCEREGGGRRVRCEGQGGGGSMGGVCNIHL